MVVRVRCMDFQRKESSRSSECPSFKGFSTQQSEQGPHPCGILAELEWRDHYPYMFRELQDLEGIDHKDYEQSVRCYETIIEIDLQGRYGRPFYLQKHPRFLVKTLPKSKVKVLKDILPAYIDHVKNNNKTLLAKYCGLHSARLTPGGERVYFVVMDNIMLGDTHLHMRYDLKGSRRGKATNRAGVDQTVMTKDLEFDMRFHIDQFIRDALLEQIKIDCKFLEEQCSIEYALLMGVHVVSRQEFFDGHYSGQLRTDEGSFNPLQACHKRDLTLTDFFSPRSRPGFHFGAALPARAFKVPVGESNSSKLSTTTQGEKQAVGTTESNEVLLYFGIIDFFQTYNVAKRLENAYRSIQNGTSISAAKPKGYSTRFHNFLARVFHEEQEDS